MIRHLLLAHLLTRATLLAPLRDKIAPTEGVAHLILSAIFLQHGAVPSPVLTARGEPAELVTHLYTCNAVALPYLSSITDLTELNGPYLLVPAHSHAQASY